MRIPRTSALLALGVWGIFFAGCATLPSGADPRTAADEAAAQAGFQKKFLPAPPFTLTAFERIKSPDSDLVVYLEGDGRAWISRSELSDDPTPRHPTALDLAFLDGSDNVAYLARPFQYTPVRSTMADAAYWSDKRFAPEVVDSMNAAVDSLKRAAGAEKIRLVGYSGGAAVAVLIAARRQDVASLRTVAGNLDPNAVDRLHHVSPLTGSLDPMEAAPALKKVPQRHFSGAKDTVVPTAVAEGFVKAIGDAGACASVKVVPGAAHSTGWKDVWKKLSQEAVDCG